VSPAVHCALQSSRHATLQLVTFEHVTWQFGLAPHWTSQLVPPLQLHCEPLQTQLVPEHVGEALLPHATTATTPTKIESQNEPIHQGFRGTARDCSNAPPRRRG